MDSLRFIDLFAGLGGFHVAMSRLGHECVFASELDEDLRAIYIRNFSGMKGKIYGDLREWKHKVPDHDVLCAGFPCQPFSKSGAQLGTQDETRGTLFHEILDILEKWRPKFVLLENVGNFGRHHSGRTWAIVKARLQELGYDVAGTEHVTPQSDRDWRDLGREPSKSGVASAPKISPKHPRHGLISPHHFGFPHHRERFYVFASLQKLSTEPFPKVNRDIQSSLNDIVQSKTAMTEADIAETRLTRQQIDCISHWNSLIKKLPSEVEPPSFPIWGDELGAMYPYEKHSPWATTPWELGQCFSPAFPKYTRKEVMLLALPSYAREPVDSFRNWKVRYIQQNREWWRLVAPYTSAEWRDRLKFSPPSRLKNPG